MKKLAAVEITFENMDCVKIPARYFKSFSIQDIHVGFDLLMDNDLFRRKTARRVRIGIKASAEKDAVSFRGDWQHATWNTLQERLDNGDITILTLWYTNNTSEDYAVLWEDMPHNEYKNRFQSFERLEDGTCFVTIEE